MAETNFNYNGLDIRVSDDYLSHSAEGLNGIPIRNSITPVSFGDGANMWAQNFDARVITVTGTLKGADASGYRAKMASLLQALSKGVERDLTITLWDGSVKQIGAYVLQQPPTTEKVGRISFNDFQIQWFCPNPFYKGTTLNTATVGLAEVTGFDFPFDFPFDFGRNGTNLITVVNAGDQLSIPTYTIDMGSGISNPVITNQTTGDYFQINRTFAANDRVVVSFDGTKVSVVLNGNQNIFTDYVSNADEFVFLESGNNTIAFTAATYDASAETLISWRDTYSYI